MWPCCPRKAETVVQETVEQTYRVPRLDGHSHDRAGHRRTQDAAGVFRNFLWHVGVELCCQFGQNPNLKLDSNKQQKVNNKRPEEGKTKKTSLITGEAAWNSKVCPNSLYNHLYTTSMTYMNFT